ncbi:hypothetical protein FQN50_009832 [Emmonsiellopsis sp. PD_5]|nr:hypothetical protein FQN50_009832 [Emmonsiellopsis sp. PD_5]
MDPPADILKILPNDPIFEEILRAASTFTGPIVTHIDGFEADYNRVLRDLQIWHEMLYQNLPSSMFGAEGLLHEARPYICTLSLSGYRYIIAFYTVLAMGGACIPLAPDTSPEDVVEIIQKAETKVLLVDRDSVPLADKIALLIPGGITQIIIPPIDSFSDSAAQYRVGINENAVMSPERPAIAIATSGTTGKPKMIVHNRRHFHCKFTPGQWKAVLSYRPPYWLRGTTDLVFPIVQGYRVHILPDSASAALFWKSIHDRSFTTMTGSAYFFLLMKNYFQKHLSLLPQQTLDEYIDCLCQLEDIQCTASMVDPDTLEFWKKLCGGYRFVNIYGSTECGVIMQTKAGSKIENSFGAPLPGVSVKLSKADHGEILVKSLTMFSHFLGDEAATQAAFDAEGYYKTSDLAHKVGDEYIFDGRAATDFVLFDSKRVSILEVEQRLMCLPYLSEACVLAAPYRATKEVVAAVVRPAWEEEKNSVDYGEPKARCDITLERIRSDLSVSLAKYKLPAMLRVLQRDEEIPRTVSQKPVRRKVLEQYFKISGYIAADYEEQGVQMWGETFSSPAASGLYR